MSINLSEKHIPLSPGVYLFRDRHGRVLYIGKAANLKNRLNSYFNKNLGNPRLQKMLETTKGVDWQETDSEIEALILESQLIKKYRPPFNVMLRDDKQYFYIIFTKENFPRIFITHQPKGLPSEALAPGLRSRPSSPSEVAEGLRRTGSGRFGGIGKEGPFTDGTALKITLKLLRRIFPYCTCKQKHNNYCLNYHIGNCSGFCCLKKEVTAKQAAAYKKNIAAIKEILSGKKKSLIKKFEKEMNAIAGKGNLEKAIELRDKIEKLKNVFENIRIINEMERKEIDRLNDLAELKKAFNLSVSPKRIEGYDVSNIQGEFATGAMAVFIDGQPDKNEYRKFKIRRILPSEASRTRPSQLKRLLRRSRRGGYGDTQMLAEVLHRRFNHPEWPYPDLILIDGGKGQLNAAATVISKQIKMMKILPIRPKRIEDPRSAQPIGTIIALTKNIKHKGHHIYASTKKSVMPLKNLPPAVRNLILQIDAEAHRFAIGYYRKLHREAQN